MCWKVCARLPCEAVASLTTHCSVSLSLAAGKSHRRDAADSLQQAPRLAIPAPDEEDVKRLWCSQVLWVEKKLTCSDSGNLAEDKQMLTPGNICSTHARRLPELMLLYLLMRTKRRKGWNSPNSGEVNQGRTKMN